MSKEVSIEEIEQYLEGKDPQKYIVAVEASYGSQYVSLIINDPETGKRIEKHKLKPFMWAKHDGLMKLCGGDKNKISQTLRENKISIKKTKIAHENGDIPDRMLNGFVYLIEGNCSYGDFINVFKRHGCDIFDSENRKDFITLSIVEQYLIQSGKRLFKGMEDYNDLHRLQFDLETTGLNPKIDRIFSIGIKDNRGQEITLEIEGDAEEELRDKELLAIETFFAIVDELKPDLIAGYNSEYFDFDFFIERCHQLGSNIQNVAITLDPEIKFKLDKNGKRIEGTVKYGSETEYYPKTEMWGYNIIDIMHAVRRAQAINSDIKKAGLKYITKFSKIAKPNRVYVKGDMIHNTWADTLNRYAFNNEDGDWYIITEKKPLKNGYEETTGRYIVNRYLLDDLWETEQVDFSFNQSSFLLAKIVPTTYSKVSTMGTASLWKLLMCGWSYENKLGIPDYQDKKDFTGGLSRLLECGYARKVVKFDYAALYPNEQLTHDIFPEFDISGVMKSILLYIAVTRDKYKALKGKHKKRADKIKAEMDKYEAEGKLTPELKKKCKDAIAKHSKLAADADKKQLPIKILANSFFGSFGAPNIFPWGDTDKAEEITCRGRQYLRLLVSHFWEKYGFRPLVGDTDGFNFAVPDNIDDFEYIGQGLHRFTEKGKFYKGVDAAVAEFNDLYMEGRMGLDIDEFAESTINFSRKNYADLIDGEVKLVGNSIKSKKMEVYIEEFFDIGIRLLLEGKGKEFIELYYEHVDMIYNYQIPLAKIASKGRIKQTVAEYKKKSKQLNKAGNPMPRQAHMELVIHHNLPVNLGDTIYYVNIGDSKGSGDIKTNKIMMDLPIVIDKIYRVIGKRAKFKIEEFIYSDNSKKETNEIVSCKGYFVNKEDEKIILPIDKIKREQIATGKVDVELNCKLISSEQIEKDPELTTDEYNVNRYLEKFNKRLKPLLVVFHPDIRDRILINVEIDKKTKNTFLPEREIFTKKECELTAGIPYNEEDQDTYEALMTMEDKEISFWIRVNKIPNNIDLNKWEEVKSDYIIRLAKAKEEGLIHEKELLDEKIKKLEKSSLDEFSRLVETDPDGMYIWVIDNLRVDLDFDEEIEEHYLKSFKWGEKLCDATEIFKYRAEAEERYDYYLGLDFDKLRCSTEKSDGMTDLELGYIEWTKRQENKE